MKPDKEADADLASVLAQFTNLIMNERVRAYNEGVDDEHARWEKAVRDAPGLDENGYICTKASVLDCHAQQLNQER